MAACWCSEFLDTWDFNDLRQCGWQSLILKFCIFSGRWGYETGSASACQITSKSLKRLRRYGDLTVFKMAAVRRLGLLKFEVFNGMHG